MFSKHHIFVTPIIHDEFQGLRITPNPPTDGFAVANVYTRSVT